MTATANWALDSKTYKELYKRFYDKRGPEELLDLAGSLKDKTILDLCAGDGRLSLEAIKRGANCIYVVEKERQMLSEALWQNAYEPPNIILPLVEKVEELLTTFGDINHMDAVFCQQAVNYWLNGDTAKLVADILKKNHFFIFNTFSQKPPEKPAVKEYELDGKKFVEVSWLVGETVHHIQIREGMTPHISKFKWLSPEYLDEILKPYFAIEVIRDGNTAIYRCSKL